MTSSFMVTFTGRVISGAQRGRTLDVPTINITLEDVPDNLAAGIYACYVQMDDGSEPLPAVMHYGPRPVFRDTQSCEVHLIDRTISHAPTRMTIAVVEYLREVVNFPIKEVLQEQMKSDIRVARDILGLPAPSKSR